MSLQVWLPLNGNLDNQGLRDIEITSSNIAYTTGNLGNNATFSSSYIGLDGKIFEEVINNCSFAFWMKASSISGNGCFYNGRLAAGAPIALFRIGDKFRFDDGMQNTFNAYSIPVNEWHHVAVTRNPTEIKLYIDGILIETKTSSGSCSTTANKATIGMSSTNTVEGNSNPFVGQLADYRIYDHCLSEKEVREIAKGLVLHYKLNDNDSDIEWDCSGFSRNGTKLNGIISDTNTPRYNTSYKLNGTNSTIEINSPGLGTVLNNPCSIAFWLYSNDKGRRSIYFSSYDANPFWCLEKSAGELFRYDWNGSVDLYSSGVTIPDKEWVHICFVRESTTSAKLYLNGALNYTYTSTTPSLNLGDIWRIGRDIQTGDGTPLNGNLSDFRIYATALSAEDVKELYENKISIDSKENLWAYEFIEE